MPSDPSPAAWGSHGLSDSAESSPPGPRSAPLRARGLRARLVRVVLLLIVGAGSFAGLWEYFRQTSEAAACEKAVRARDWEQLKLTATKWLEQSPRNGDAWMYLALAAEKQGDLPWAAAALGRVPQSHPGFVPALHRRLALTSGALNRPLEAAETLERLLSADPHNPEVHQQAIAFYANTFQHARLVEQIRSSVSLKCERPEAYIYLAGADNVRASGRATLQERWVRAHPDCPLFSAAKTLSLMCERPPESQVAAHSSVTSEAAPAIEARLEAALARLPDNPELLALRIEQAIAGHEVRQVCQLLDRAPVRTRDDDRFWRYAAWRYAALGEPKEAETACRRSLELNPLSWKTRRMLATFLRDAGSVDEADALEQTANEGEAIHALVTEIDDPAAPATAFLRRLANHAAACHDDLVARGIARHLD